MENIRECTTVERGDKRVVLDNTGFLIEDDTFWWNETVYFKTNHQQSLTAYTYKYPDNDDMTDSIQNIIKQYMNEFESALYSKGDVSHYIDYESFAKWILIHDILGTDDSAGCNRFLYKYNYDKNNPFSSKLKMGPVWDYDSTFRSDDWSSIHTTNSWFYYSLLFEREDFVDVYLNLWKQVRPVILNELKIYFDEFLYKYKNVFDESIKLHQTIYPGEGKQTVSFQVNEILEKFTQRIALLDVLITQYGYSDDVNSIKNNNAQLIDIVNLQGNSVKTIDFHCLPSGVYIFKYSDGQYRKVKI